MSIHHGIIILNENKKRKFFNFIHIFILQLKLIEPGDWIDFESNRKNKFFINFFSHILHNQ